MACPIIASSIAGYRFAYALRSRSLCNLDLTRHLIWDSMNGKPRCTLRVTEDISKTRKEHEREIESERAALIAEHVKLFRPYLPGSDSSYLFPGTHGSHRSGNAIAEAVKATALKYLGIRFNTHLFRHAFGKIVLERNPGASYLVQLELGHSSIDTTYASYLGTETRAAGRHLDQLIEREFGQLEASRRINDLLDDIVGDDDPWADERKRT